MASKGILVSDPTLHSMTPARWVYEYAGLLSNREHQWRTTQKLVKDALVHFLGLDLIPPGEDKDTGEFSAPAVEYLPLIAFLNPKFFHDTMSKKARFEEQNKSPSAASSTPDVMGYDEMTANFNDVADTVDAMFDENDVADKIYQERLAQAQKAGVFHNDPPPPNTQEPLSAGRKLKVRIE